MFFHLFRGIISTSAYSKRRDLQWVLQPFLTQCRSFCSDRKHFSRRIPGISALRHAAPESIPELEAKYPDAAFALMISDNLFVGDREQNEIHQKAYTAILSGESIPGVRFRYDYDTESYLRRHMWD